MADTLPANYLKITVIKIVIKVAIATVKENKMEVQPKDTSKKHFYVSLVKSFIRIVAGVWLMTGNFLMAGVCLVLAELLGIVEEIV